MATELEIPQGLFSRCMHWSGEIASITDSSLRIAYFHSVLPDLLSDRELFRQILQGMADGAGYPDIEEPTMFPNEVILFRDPGREFSVRMYLWAQGEFDPVHDHNSWGVIGAVSGSIEVVGYHRQDDGSNDIHALLKEASRITVTEGQTCPVLMLNKGIHKTGNAHSSTVVQVNVYGRNLTGRNYIHVFDTDTGAISRLYTPQIKKQVLAQDALLSL
jgi:predicted metal-dependent enzyme (double-stranded beta helix superfamily)